MEINEARKLFQTARPMYSDKHMDAILAHVAANDIPFCAKCVDWHFSDDECSA